MATGQRAMAVAMLRPEPEKRGRGNKSTRNGEFSGVSRQLRIAGCDRLPPHAGVLPDVAGYADMSAYYRM